jgi:hypothetical protein
MKSSLIVAIWYAVYAAVHFWRKDRLKSGYLASILKAVIVMSASVYASFGAIPAALANLSK